VSTEARFATGDWYAVVGDEVVVLLPGSQRGRVAEVWDLADAGAGADAVLDALLAGGLSSLDHFALVARGAEVTRLIVRGVPSATVSGTGGDELVAAAPGTAWAERLLTGPTGLRITLTGNGAADLPLTAGVARVSVVELGNQAAAEPAPASFAPVEQPAVAAEPVEQSVAVDEPTPEPYADPVPEVPELPEVPDVPAASPLPGAFAEAAPAPDPLSDPFPSAPMTFGEPGDDPTPTGATPVVEEPVAEEPWSEHDGQTQAGAPIPDFARPPVPGQEIAPDVISRPVASLVFSTGDVVLVDRTVLVGRAPEARRFASHDQPHVVSVPSPQQEISSTHLEIRPGAGADHGSAIATDLGSTNGTVLAQPGLEPEELKPGIAVSLVPGAVLDLGDGVTIQVTNP
jgi:hypothetical protein